MRHTKIISSRMYSGQGLGNQLWIYATTRAFAAEHQIEYRIECSWRFKGKKFLSLYPGRRGLYLPLKYPRRSHIGIFEDRYVEEKWRIPGFSFDFAPYKEFSSGKRRFRIEGNFESEQYLVDIREQLKKELQVANPIKIPESLCIISIRGGDYLGNSETLLDKNYYLTAIELMKAQYAKVNFAIVTDDAGYAKEMLPGIPVLTGSIANYTFPTASDSGKIELDFSILQNAKKLIIGNSSFAWWATWTNPNSPFVIAPRFWDAYKSRLQVWAPNSILTKDWFWLSKEGILRSYEEESQLIDRAIVPNINKVSDAFVTSNWIAGKPRHALRNWFFGKFENMTWFRIVNSWRKRILK